MSISTKVVWDGDKVKKDFEKAERIALTKAAILVRGKAVKLSPVDTGLLRNSITYVISGDKEDFPGAVQEGDKFTFGDNQSITAKPGEAIIGTVVFYAPYMEFGTRYVEARAFLLPAFQSSLNQIKKIFEQEYKNTRWL